MPDPRTPDSDVPPADWPDEHPEGFEDGYFEDWQDDDDDGTGYPPEEGWG